MRLYNISVTTESGDKYVFNVKSMHKPTDEQVDAMLYQQLETEYQEVGYVNWELTECSWLLLPTEAEIDELNENRKRS